MQHHRSHHLLRPLLLALLLSSTSVAAQLSPTRPVVFGWVSSPLLPASGSLQSQDVDNKCQPAKRLCSPVLLNNARLYAGGTAYDSRDQSAWVSDGRTLVKVDLRSCKTTCTPKPAIMKQGAVFSGLAVSSRRGMLYHLETTPGYAGILPWNNKACPPVPTKGGCFLQLPKLSTAGGLAYDEVRDLLYYTVSTPGTAGPTNTLHVASPTSACKPICSIKLPACGGSTLLSTIEGLAYDPCSKTLYATDGQTTMRLSMVDPLKCQIKMLGCCPKQTGGGRYQGLALIPGWEQKSFGKSCITKGCPFCPNLKTAVYGGDPRPGNPDFGIEIRNGPTGSVATLAIGMGGCTSGIPFLCGRLHLSLTVPSILIPLGKMTGTQCQAHVRLNVPIPADAGICGLTVCLQSLALCGGSSSTHAMSQGLQLSLTP